MNHFSAFIYKEEKPKHEWKWSPARLCISDSDRYSLKQVIFFMVLGCFPFWHELSKVQENDANQRHVRALELISGTDHTSIVDIYSTHSWPRKHISRVSKRLCGSRLSSQRLLYVHLRSKSLKIEFVFTTGTTRSPLQSPGWGCYQQVVTYTSSVDTNVRFKSTLHTNS